MGTVLLKLCCALALLSRSYSFPTQLKARDLNLTSIPRAPDSMDLREGRSHEIEVNVAEAAHALFSFTDRMWRQPPPDLERLTIDDDESYTSTTVALSLQNYHMRDMVAWTSLQTFEKQLSYMAIDQQTWRLRKSTIYVSSVRQGNVDFNRIPRPGLGAVNASGPLEGPELELSNDTTTKSLLFANTSSPANPDIPINVYREDEGRPINRLPVLYLIYNFLEPIWARNYDSEIADVVRKGQTMRKTSLGISMTVTYNQLEYGPRDITWDFIVSSIQSILLHFALDGMDAWVEATYKASFGTKAGTFFTIRFDLMSNDEGSDRVVFY